MTYVSYFEIGGHVIESFADEPTQPLIKSMITIAEKMTPVIKNSVVRKEISKTQPKPAVVNETAAFRRQMGQAMMRTGGFILAVPDPLPLIDETVAAGLLMGGALLWMGSREIPEGKSYYGYYERGDDGWRRSR